MDRVALKVAALFVVLACLSVGQLAQWRSDVALWSVAANVNQTSPRPALNLGIALRRAGRPLESARWLVVAADRSTGHQDEANYRRAVAAQFFALEVSGVFLCDSPQLQPYCLPSR